MVCAVCAAARMPALVLPMQPKHSASQSTAWICQTAHWRDEAPSRQARWSRSSLDTAERTVPRDVLCFSDTRCLSAIVQPREGCSPTARTSRTAYTGARRPSSAAPRSRRAQSERFAAGARFGQGESPLRKAGSQSPGRTPFGSQLAARDAALGCLRNGPADKRASTQLPSTRPTVTSARTSCLPGGSPGSRTRCPMRADRCRWGTSGPAGTSRMGSPRSKCKSSAVAMAHVPDGQSAGWGQPALCEGHHGGRTQTSRNVLSKCSQIVCTQAIARSNGR